MFKVLLESSGNVLGIQASGKLTEEDYKEILIPRLEEIAGAGEKAAILLYMDDSFEGWELEAMWQDFKVGIGKYRHDFHKFALVGAPKWVDILMELDGIVTSATVKTFEGGQLEEAWIWIKGDS